MLARDVAGGTRHKQGLPATVRGTTTKNPSKAATSKNPTEEVKTVSVTGPANAPTVTVTLSNHLNIEGTHYAPGAKVRVSADYARRLRLPGYVARS
ncbi:hypothetical protein [Streptomyces sp. f150]|uniref:hypothetical protein n=1 Tax=Streptomyces sp. f150 TaxID=1827699 RepID=UPI000BF1A0E1|nr:hypothetical protein [Streptomyces sp. f150]